MLILWVHDIIPKDPMTQKIFLSVISYQVHLKDNLSAIRVRTHPFKVFLSYKKSKYRQGYFIFLKTIVTEARQIILSKLKC